MAAKLWRGSSGSSVRDLQTKLNQNGYKLDVDGVFGNKTYNAVLDYQRKNKLAVDGVVGNETWGSLGKQQTVDQKSTTAQKSTTTGSTYTPYDPSSNKAYQEAMASLKNAQQGTPQYSGTYDGQIKDLYEQIVNRDKFTYDVNGDALFQQYKDLYQQQGKQAMMDTMGQAAALTGGYGNSYAQTVGQQTYQGYLQKLGEVVPELYQQAYSRYQDEGNKMMQQYEMLGDLKNDEYSKYQDAYNRWLTEREYAQGNADTAYDRGYNLWLQEMNQRNTDREFAESVRQYNETLAENKRQFNAQQAAAAAARAASARRSSSGSSGGTTKKSSKITVTKNKNKESAAGGGVTSFSNIQQTIRGHMMSGHPEKAEQLIASVWNQLDANQKKDIENMGFKIG